jgi:hypothetical protein
MSNHPLKAAPDPDPDPEPAADKPPAPRTPAELFGKRMFQFADLLLGVEIDKQRFGHLMQNIAEDFTNMTEAEYYDRMKDATDLLPMTRKQARAFAEKIRGHLKTVMGNDDE